MEALTAAVNNMAAEMSHLSSDISEVKSTVTSLKQDINQRQEVFESKVINHEVQLKSIFRRDTKRNLVIFGWPDIDKTPNKNIREKVHDLLANKLQIQEVRTFDIENVRAVGKKKNLVIATLYSAELVRQAILNASKLKGSNVFLSYDSSPEERAMKKKLIQHKKILTEKGNLCKVQSKTLIVNSVAYTLEQLDNGALNQGAFTQDVEMNDSSKRQSKRQLSVSPEEVDKIKKTKQGSPMLQSNNISFNTDSEEFDDTISQDEQKNGKAVPRQ